MSKTSVVLLFNEEKAFSGLIDGRPPIFAYSHNMHLMQFGHESLRKGFNVYMGLYCMAAEESKLVKVLQFYPVLKTKTLPNLSLERIKPALVVVLEPIALETGRLYPKAKFVSIIAAARFVEGPELISPGWIYGYAMLARYHADFFLIQNVRQAELTSCFFRSVAQVDMRARTLVCPLGIVEEQRRSMPPRAVTRAEMKLKPGDIAIINAGGPWSWTDHNTFLRAFCNVVHSGISNIKFYVMGLKQFGNNDHEHYLKETKAIITTNTDLVGRNLIVYQDWEKASTKVHRFTHAADIGINVNKDGIENWQSYRVRFLEYMQAGIPVINTEGDYLSTHEAADAVYMAQTGNVKSYEAAIRLAVTDHALRAQKTEAMKRCAEKFDSRNTYGRVIDRLLVLPRRNFKDPKATFGPSLFDISSPGESAWVSDAVGKIIDNTSTSDLVKEIQRRAAALSSKPILAANDQWLWRAPATWKGGHGGAQPYDVPPLLAKDRSMSLGFDIRLRKAVNAKWVEVVQVGKQREESRLIIYIEPYNAKSYRLALRLTDNKGKISVLLTPHLAVGKIVRCHLQIFPAVGWVRFVLDGKSHNNLMSSPWEWISTSRIWLGSRRLPATLSRFWLKSAREGAEAVFRAVESKKAL